MIDFPCTLGYTFLMHERVYSAAVIGPAGGMEEIDTARGLMAIDSIDLPENVVSEDLWRVHIFELHK
jgi:hypothetical protein